MANGITPAQTFLRTARSAYELERERQRQAIADQLNQELKTIQIAAARQQLAEAMKTPSERLAEQLTALQAQRALQTGALTRGPSGLGQIALPRAVGVTEQDLAALESAAIPQVPIVETSVQAPVMDLQPTVLQIETPVLAPAPTFDDFLTETITQQAPQFRIAPSAPVEFQREIPGLPGFYEDPSLAREAAQRQVDLQNIIERSKIREISPGATIASLEQLERGEGFTAPARGAAARPLEFRDVGNAWVGLDPSTGREVSRTPKTPGFGYRASPSGLVRTSIGPNGEPVEEIVPGTGPVAGARGEGLKPGTDESKTFRITASVNKEVNNTISMVDELQRTGKFPNITQTMINQFLSSRPQDIPGGGAIPGLKEIYAGLQRSVQSARTPEARELEMRRAFIASNLIRAYAGLAQTAPEITNVLPFTPQSVQDIDSMKMVLSFLKTKSEDDMGIFQKLYPGYFDQFTTGQTRPSIQQDGRSFSASTIEDAESAARNAGFKNGDSVILNGQPGILR